MITQASTPFADGDTFQIIDKNDGMRYAGVHAMHDQRFASDGQALSEIQAVWGAHVDAHLTAFELGRNHSCQGFKANHRELVTMQMIDEAAKASCAIATHLGFATISVVVAHLEVAAIGCRFDTEQAVCTDSTVSVAEFFDLRSGQSQG